MYKQTNCVVHHYHHHVPEGLGMLACYLILKMKLVPPSLPRSSYVSSSIWFVFSNCVVTKLIYTFG